MDEKILQGLIEANQAEKERTPYLDMALGGLRTALDNLRSHLAAKKPAKGKTDSDK